MVKSTYQTVHDPRTSAQATQPRETPAQYELLEFLIPMLTLAEELVVRLKYGFRYGEVLMTATPAVASLRIHWRGIVL
ncbi:MAG: hypothetical protein ACR2KI_06495 [Candidatus Limnocylindria bacterium]